MSVRVLIIEDNQDIQSLILNFLKESFLNVEVVGIVASNKELNQVLENRQEIDLALVDIELNDGNSLDVLSLYFPLNFAVIFITAHEQKASNIIKYSAVDYLLKPLDLNQFKESINGALAAVKEKEKMNLMRKQLEFINDWRKIDVEYPDVILVQGVKETHFLKRTDIVRCEAQGSYCVFYTTKEEKIMASKTLKEYSEILDPQQFIRIHKSYLVNKQYVKKYLNEDGGLVLLEDGSKVPVSRRNREVLMEKMK